LKYSIDTSSLIQGFRKIFPYEIVPTFWNKHLPSLIDSGELRATEVVRWELEEQDDELLNWVAGFGDLFIDLDEAVQKRVKEILRDHPRLVHRGRSTADPFVIALAETTDGCAVVCEENRKPTAPKMPDVCDARGVRCIRLLDLVRDKGFTY